MLVGIFLYTHLDNLMLQVAVLELVQALLLDLMRILIVPPNKLQMI
jgi:hypothetical protein